MTAHVTFTMTLDDMRRLSSVLEKAYQALDATLMTHGDNQQVEDALHHVDTLRLDLETLKDLG